MGGLFTILAVSVVAFVLSVGFTGMYLPGTGNVAVAEQKACEKCKHEKCTGDCAKCPTCAEEAKKKEGEKK